eukprot:GHVO01040199.1.p1 GENE.GHVO01040199.1~~GHVO01040199.1.p1  ORF type:complete len:382 (+),score=60.19 GHVO01040199.1:65-1210(+)
MQPGDEYYEPNLNEVLNMNSLRWIFVGGKGGVGKTTTACSIAVTMAKMRKDVLILSTDPAHNVSDAFCQKFSNKPTAVKGFTNLYAMEVDASFEKSFQYTLDTGDSEWSKMLPDLMNSIPGVDEAFSFAEMMNSVQTMSYSCIVFDTAPTGHTLRLLSFPSILEQGLKKLAGVRDKLKGAISMIGMMNPSGVDEDNMMTKLDHLRAVTSSVKETFRDPTLTTFICVCIPEFLSVYETERLVQELAKQEIDCSNIVVNQVLFPVDVPESSENARLNSASATPHEIPPSSADSIKKLVEENTRLQNELMRVQNKADAYEKSHYSRRKMQSKYLLQIQDLYATDFHIVCMPLQASEVRGIELLENFGELLQNSRDLPIVNDVEI